MNKIVMVGMIAAVLSSQSVGASAMRNPFLNDLRGFDISCRADDARLGEALCASVKQILETRFAKPVTVRKAGALPPSSSGAPMSNHVWIAFSVSVDDGKTRLGAKWGSSMRMMGVPEENDAKPAEVSSGASTDDQAEAILRNTPFHLN